MIARLKISAPPADPLLEMMVALVVFCFAVLAMAWRVWSRAVEATSAAASRGMRLDKELSRLDPWSFRALPGREFGADHVVVGTTGAFAINLSRSGSVREVRSVGDARRAARRLKRRLGAAAYHGGVHALLCVDGVPAPRTILGVKVVPRSMIVKEVAERGRTAQPHQVQRVVETLARRAAR